MAALAAVAVPVPLLAGHHHHRHKDQAKPIVSPAKPATKAPSAPNSKAAHHRDPALAGTHKQTLVFQVTGAGQASNSAHKAIAHTAGDPADSIVDYKFEPASITVHVGDTITWTNNGQQPHTATANDGSFNTGTIKPGSSASHTFTTAGTFAYICSIHPFMHGTVVVEASNSSGSGGNSGSNGSNGSNGSGGSTGGSGGSTTPTSTTANSSPSSSGSASSNTGNTTSSSTLPNTGLDLTGAVLLALAMIGSGVAIRRRLRQS